MQRCSHVLASKHENQTSCKHLPVASEFAQSNSYRCCRSLCGFGGPSGDHLQYQLEISRRRKYINYQVDFRDWGLSLQTEQRREGQRPLRTGLKYAQIQHWEGNKWVCLRICFLYSGLYGISPAQGLKATSPLTPNLDIYPADTHNSCQPPRRINAQQRRNNNFYCYAACRTLICTTYTTRAGVNIGQHITMLPGHI
jgi:hypothetical protein